MQIIWIVIVSARALRDLLVLEPHCRAPDGEDLRVCRSCDLPCAQRLEGDREYLRKHGERVSELEQS